MTTARKTTPPASATALTVPDEGTPIAERLQWLHTTYKTPPAEHVSKLPKPTNRENTKGSCSECGGFHGLPAVHLDYLGHAELTDILLFVDPLWKWEPFTLDEFGQPKVMNNDRGGVMWINLTIWGVTRPGVGTSAPKGPDTYKELIGDALRNAAMRFGIGLDLWSKAEGVDRRIEAGQHVEPDSDHDPNRQPAPGDVPSRTQPEKAQAEPDVWTYDGLVAQGLRTLNKMCRERELPCTGKVEDYAERLMTWRAENATPTGSKADIPPPDSPETDTADAGATDTPPEPASGDVVGEEPDGDDADAAEWDKATADPAGVAAILDDVKKLKGAKARAYATYKRETGVPAKPAEWTNADLEGIVEFLDRLDAPVAS